MFKKSLFLGCALTASMSAGLMGMETAKNSLTSAMKYVDGPNTELATAALRSYLVYSSANTKHAGRIKLALTDLARIANELVAYGNYKKLKADNDGRNLDDKNIARNLSLLLVLNDVLSLGKHVVVGGEEHHGDKKLKGIAKLIDTQILPILEGAASVIRAVDTFSYNGSMLSADATAKIGVLETTIGMAGRTDYWCTFTIVTARLFSSMVNSGLGSKALKWQLLAMVAYGLTVLNDVNPKLFGKICRPALHVLLVDTDKKDFAEKSIFTVLKERLTALVKKETKTV